MADGNLRIKVSIGGFEIELEGESETVVRQFEDIKRNGLGRIPFAASFLSPWETEESSTNTSIKFEPTTPLVTEYESLNNVVLKQLPGSETEWVLIYAFYASDFGKKKFTRDHILDKYDESTRTSTSNRSNLSNNIKTLIRNNLLAAHSATEFIITASGIDMSKRIIDRKPK